MSDSLLKIGISANSYLEKRNFTDLSYSRKIQFIKCYSLNKPYDHLLFKFFGRINPDSHFTFKDSIYNRVNLFHLFGTIYFGKKPWIVTSSVVLPRWSKLDKGKAYSQLAKNNCKKIIFLSQIAFNRQLDELEQFPILKQKISQKMMILHPSQPILINDISEKGKIGDCPIFTLVGHRILGKGGYEILKVFKKLHEENKKFKLIIISKLHIVDFLRNSLTDHLLEETKKMIDESKISFLEYHSELPNEKVLEILKKSDVALLPSYDDTYGYSILESQACGCPVVTTDIMAFPEINNNELGWMLEMPKLMHGKPDAFGSEKYQIFSELLEFKLYHVLKEILNHPEIIRLKAEKAFNKIKTENNPAVNAKILEKIYQTIES